MPYAQVIVDIAHSEVDRIFDYRLPEGQPYAPGMRVKVPFGPRVVEGYIIRILEKSDYPQERIKEVIAPLEQYPAITPELMRTALWMQDYCHCMLVEALRAMLPAQMRGERIGIKLRKVIVGTVDAAEYMRIIGEMPTNAPRQKEILERLSRGERVLMDAKTASAARALVKKGLASFADEEVFRSPYPSLIAEPEPHFPLTREQEDARERIARGMEAGEGVFLLHGVTGSGKTEVYFHCVQHALSAGKTAIILVPEISLTPQMVERYRARFGANAAVLHSRLSPGERYDEWRRLRMGQARVAIGARSAVFAPLFHIGLIIVDEEHEQSYRAENAPRYDARSVAAMRCRHFGAALVLGSATPSVEHFAQALQGRMTLLTLTRRATDMPLPDVRIVDMRQELMRGNRTIFSGLLYQEMKSCLSAGDQMILYLNRRGYAPFVSCRDCGEAIKCPHCDVSMIYHRSDNRMHCHYCAAIRELPDLCPGCKGKNIRQFGLGTQRVEEEMRKLFPDASLLRMDYDTTREKEAHLHLLQQFESRQAQVLIGTQMVAKGLDFPDVTLVGIVAADMTLQLPDFRSAERTFELITQVAGRAGRAQKSGSVVLQTYQPDHYAITTAARQDYRAFYDQEIGMRRREAYPPFAHFVRVLIQGGEEMEVLGAAERFCQNAEKEVFSDPAHAGRLIFMLSQPSPISRIKEVYRAQALFKLKERGYRETARALYELMGRMKSRKTVAFIEIDPYNMT